MPTKRSGYVAATDATKSFCIRAKAWAAFGAAQ
jgi:hypothetical protein